MNVCLLSALSILGKTYPEFEILGKIYECVQMNKVWSSSKIHTFHGHRQDDPTTDLPCRTSVP